MLKNFEEIFNLKKNLSEESAITCILTLTNHIKNIFGEISYFK